MAESREVDERRKLTRKQVEEVVRKARRRGERPNLSGADLIGADLSGVDLSGANLRWADLRANLERANLSGADLIGADLRANLYEANLLEANLYRANLYRANLCLANLRRAVLWWADLSEANLSNTDLEMTDLSEANLSNTDLSWADLTETKLDSTNFSNAIINRTKFIDVDLSQAKGLTSVNHEGPSAIDLNTIRRSKGKIPEIFLEKAGVDATIIRWQRSLHNLPTVFICYSHKDEKDKDLLVTHLSILKELGTLDIWDDTQITGGANWEEEIIKAIARSSIAILLVSANLLTSKIINTLEIPQFLQRHNQDKDFIIYPIIIKPCHWEAVPWLKKIEVKPKGGKPIWGGSTKADKELSKIASEVEGIIKDRWWKAFS